MTKEWSLVKTRTWIFKMTFNNQGLPTLRCYLIKPMEWVELEDDYYPVWR